jgi:hypothetical protein
MRKKFLWNFHLGKSIKAILNLYLRDFVWPSSTCCKDTHKVTSYISIFMHRKMPKVEDQGSNRLIKNVNPSSACTKRFSCESERFSHMCMGWIWGKIPKRFTSFILNLQNEFRIIFHDILKVSKEKSNYFKGKNPFRKIPSAIKHDFSRQSISSIFLFSFLHI